MSSRSRLPRQKDPVTDRLSKLGIHNGRSPICGGLKGLEKESLRITNTGSISETPHPPALGSPLTHPFITTDFAESLPEFITPEFEATGDSLAFLHDLHAFAIKAMDDEILWAASMPCAVEDDVNIRIAEYGSSNIGRMKHIYRMGLDYRYGRRMQAIAGVHFNYSLPLDFWPAFMEAEGRTGDMRGFIDDCYFSLIRNFKRISWLVLFLFGNSPAVCRSFLGGRTSRFRKFDPGTYYLPYATSLRMSDIGYKNKNQMALHISYDNLGAYNASMLDAIETPYPEYEAIGIWDNDERVQLSTNVLQIENEYYSVIRPKQRVNAGEKPTTALGKRGVRYVEIRALDLDTRNPLGIDSCQMHFLEALMIYCLLDHSPLITAREENDITYNDLTVALRGRESGVSLVDHGKRHGLRDWAEEITDRMQQICEILDKGSPDNEYQQALDAQRVAIKQSDLLPSARLLAELAEKRLPFAKYIFERSSAYADQLRTANVTPKRLGQFESATRESISAQQNLESPDAEPFDQYLDRYLRHG